MKDSKNTDYITIYHINEDVVRMGKYLSSTSYTAAFPLIRKLQQSFCRLKEKCIHALCSIMIIACNEANDLTAINNRFASPF